LAQWHSMVCIVSRVMRATTLRIFIVFGEFTNMIDLTWFCLSTMVRVMVFNPTFNNISVISWLSVLLVEETRVTRANQRPVTSHWQTLSHNVVSSTPFLNGIRTKDFHCFWWIYEYDRSYLILSFYNIDHLHYEISAYHH
jgi:hypothetical protein